MAANRTRAATEPPVGDLIRGPGAEPTVPLTTGVTVLDELIDGVRVGDNLVIVADTPTALDAVGRAYVTAAPAPTSLVVVPTESRLLDALPAGTVVLDHAGGDTDASTLVDQVADADVRVGRGATFLIDSLTGVQRRWGADAALELFLATCPRLYRRGSVAMWLLDATQHDDAFLQRLREITQVVVHLHADDPEHPEALEAEVVAAAGRPVTTPGRRQRVHLEDGTLLAAGPIASGRDRLGDLIRTQRVSRGLAQAEVARRVGISPSALSQVERGRRGLAAETLIRIWDVLDVPFGPQDTVQRGYRVGRRSGHQAVELATGVTGWLRFDDPHVGRCWELSFAPGARGQVPLFSGKSSDALLLQRGVLDLQVGGHHETLHEGDSLVTTHATIGRWHNPGPAAATALWTLST